MNDVKKVTKDSKRLKQVIKYSDLNQSEFAESINYSQDTINKIANGHAEISKGAGIAIAKKYQIDLYWLMTGEGEMLMAGGILVKDLDNRIKELEQRCHRYEGIIDDLRNSKNSEHLNQKIRELENKIDGHIRNSKQT